MTWCSRMVLSWALFSGVRRVSTVPGGSLSKAPFTGANTVNGPGLARASSQFAAFRAATSVVWSFESEAIFAMDGVVELSEASWAPAAAGVETAAPSPAGLQEAAVMTEATASNQRLRLGMRSSGGLEWPV